jgi:hypothetical protein
MDADIEPLLTRVFCTAGNRLAGRQANTAKSVTDAEAVASCLA